MTHLDAWKDPDVARRYEARRFSSWFGSVKHFRDEALVAELVGPDARRVLDAASGTGRLLDALIRPGREVVACDVALEMMRAGRLPRAAPVLGFVQGSALSLPFLSDAFDAAVCMRFLFHVEERPARVAILRELARVCSGIVVGEVRYRWNAKQAGRFVRSRVGLAKRWRPSEGRAGIERELDEAGLEVVRLVPKSRLFSDKALFVARRLAKPRPMT